MDEQNRALIKLVRVLQDYSDLKNRDDKRKKLQSGRNKRYYQRHIEAIKNKNKEMRDLYKLVKQN